MKVGVIIVCAGEGRRLGTIDKSLLKLRGKPLFYNTLLRFTGITKIKEIVLVLRKEHVSLAQRLIKQNKTKQFPRVTFTEGGKERKDSVFNGLQALGSTLDTVLIHDGARPLVSQELIKRMIKELEMHAAVICGIKARDTLKIVVKDRVKKTISRDKIYSIQTPQGFRRGVLVKAYQKARVRKGYDDALLVERLGNNIKVIEGDPHNIKITYPEDIALAKALLQTQKRNGKYCRGRF